MYNDQFNGSLLNKSINFFFFFNHNDYKLFDYKQLTWSALSFKRLLLHIRRELRLQSDFEVVPESC